VQRETVDLPDFEAKPQLEQNLLLYDFNGNRA
jgi:hypothetical protein